MAQYVGLIGLNRSAGVRVPAWIQAAENEVQNVDFDGTPTSGTWTLSYGGDTTTPLAFDDTTAEVQTALEALDTLDSGDVAVTGAAGAYVVTFGGTLAGTDVEELVAVDIDLDDPGVTVTTASPGDTIDYAPVKVTPNAVVIVDVDRADVRKALNAHRSIGQYAVAAVNPDVHGTALPTNT